MPSKTNGMTLTAWKYKLKRKGSEKENRYELTCICSLVNLCNASTKEYISQETKEQTIGHACINLEFSFEGVSWMWEI